MSATFQFPAALPDGSQWLRKATLRLTKTPNPTSAFTLELDLSEFHFRFEVNSSCYPTPNLCTVRIYNVSPRTARTIVDEYDFMYLTAGYQPNHDAVIFAGTIRKYVRGRENVTDSYIEMTASTGDINFNFGFVNVTLGGNGAKSSYTDYYNALCQSMNLAIDSVSQNIINTSLSSLYNPGERGVMMIGTARSRLDQLAKSIGVYWSVQTINGVNTLILFQPTQPRPGAPVVLGPTTGLIGVPEATVDGIQAKCLLNPLLYIGSLVQIDQVLIAATDQPISRLQLPGYGPSSFETITAPTAPKGGLYCVLAVSHVGDTRGQEWYTSIICLASSLSAAATASEQGGISGSA